MPFGDGTGPYGTGPVGFRRGNCRTGTKTTWPTWRYLRTKLEPAEERQLLKEQRKELASLLADIDRRLKQLAK